MVYKLVRRYIFFFSLLQENWRHKRVRKRASRFDVADLLEIAAMKGLRPRDVQAAEESADESAGDEAEPAPVLAAGASGAAGSGVIRHAAGSAAGEAEPPALAGTVILPTMSAKVFAQILRWMRDITKKTPKESTLDRESCHCEGKEP